MRAWLLTILVSTAAWANEGESIRLTAGWVRVLDVAELQSARSADEAVLNVTRVGPDQVVMIGADEGETTLSVWSGPPGAMTRTDHLVVVIRGHTLFPFDGLLKVDVDDRRTLHGEGLTRVAIGDATICEAELTGAESLSLVPRRPGTTSMIVWANGTTAAHRRQILVTVESGGITRTADEVDAVHTEPLTGRLGLVAGEHLILELPRASRLAVTDPTVAAARAGQPGEIIVEGLSSGATSLLVWSGKRNRPRSLFVVVHPRSQPELEPEPDDEEELPIKPIPLMQDL